MTSTPIRHPRPPARLSGPRVLECRRAAQAETIDVRLEVILERGGVKLPVRVADSECGMERDVVNKRLIKPVDTTKCKAESDIGAYENLQVILTTGDPIVIGNEPGGGRVFTGDQAPKADRGVALTAS